MLSNRLIRTALLVLSLGAFCACGKESGNTKKETETADLLVCSFNIRYPEPADGDYIWDNRKDAVCKFILTRKPDIVAMQEVEKVQAEYILKKVGDEYGLYGIGRDTGKNILESTTDETSKTILYRKDRFSLAGKGTFWHSDNPNQVMAKNGSNDFGSFHLTHRNVTGWLKLVDEEKMGRTVWVFDTHFQNNKNCTDAAGKRMLQTNLHLQMVPEIIGGPIGSSCKDAVILAGDFNAVFSSDELQRLRNVPLGYAREDAERSSHRSTITDNGFGHPGNIIDHIFFCGPLKCLNYSVDKRDYGILYISDHYPILSEFSYTDK
ncbi:MAG: endonuclease/exonuclease/phosphatase family protein [Bacteroidales bacterium]|nr:endonuclease/exonuclease/phosphatase family protein [Bacteroidales bacterium]